MSGGYGPNGEWLPVAGPQSFNKLGGRIKLNEDSAMSEPLTVFGFSPIPHFDQADDAVIRVFSPMG